ncbi:SGNH/GDSL hydrolase family protein [Mucisphaera calidilacus]|uniref:Phosphatidylcholine-sterol acyltransferase n=1 Tax=Mucisphaera calidilacus TaxID=2527982 RepID=A0A518C0R6_9BACT|nr:SGNH/GDSL hydrolase family protein [Mucisphaera calidilacus]QDU72821.1 Phosphatidylcholine-sterol acyltransferase precursor [Mucisphaera calidilacus]
METRTWMALAVSTTLTASAAADYSELIVFGDSLSDVGNFFAASAGTFPVSPPYANGRFSNGPVWVEGFASGLGLTTSPSLLGGTNYAFGGSQTGTGLSLPPGQTTGTAFVPNLQTQVDGFLGTNAAASDALYVVWSGANDFFVGEQDPTVPAANVAGALSDLYDAGAREFLVANLPALGQTPQGLSSPIPGASAGLDLLTAGFNQALEANLQGLDALPGVTIHRLDVAGIVANVGALSASLGVTVLDQAYADLLTGTIIDPSLDPDTFLFWDDQHPSRVAHALLAERALLAVPEPGVLFSIGVLGGLVLRRSRASV